MAPVTPEGQKSWRIKKLAPDKCDYMLNTFCTVYPVAV